MNFLDEGTFVGKNAVSDALKDPEFKALKSDEKAKAIATLKQGGSITTEKEDNKFSSEYDDNPKLKGGQKKLPDALQKAIINRIKEMADKGYGIDQETGEFKPMSSDDAIQSWLNKIKQSLDNEDSLDEARTKIGKALFGNKTYETPFSDFVDDIENLLKGKSKDELNKDAFASISNKLTKLEKGELSKEEFNALIKALDKAGYSKNEIKRLEKKYNNSIKKKKAVKEEKELKLPADTTFTIDLKHLMQKHGKEDTIKITKKLMKQLHDKGEVSIDGTRILFKELDAPQDAQLALPEPELEKPRRKGPPRLVTFDTDAPDYLGDDDFDYEGGMAKSQMLKMKKYAAALCDMVDDETQLEAWVQAKITKASDYMSAVYHYLDYQNSKMNENQLKEGMSDKEIRDLAMKNLPNSGIPEELVEPAIKILIDGFREMEYYDIDPKLPIEHQRIPPWGLKEFPKIIKKMQISIRDLVDNYTKNNPNYKFESKIDENLNQSMMDTDEALVSILMSVARLGEESAEQVVDNLTAEDFKKAAMMMMRDDDEREIAKFVLSVTKLDENHSKKKYE